MARSKQMGHAINAHKPNPLNLSTSFATVGFLSANFCTNTLLLLPKSSAASFATDVCLLYEIWAWKLLARRRSARRLPGTSTWVSPTQRSVQGDRIPRSRSRRFVSCTRQTWWRYFGKVCISWASYTQCKIYISRPATQKFGFRFHPISIYKASVKFVWSDQNFLKARIKRIWKWMDPAADESALKIDIITNMKTNVLLTENNALDDLF